MRRRRARVDPHPPEGLGRAVDGSPVGRERELFCFYGMISSKLQRPLEQFGAVVSTLDGEHSNDSIEGQAER